ncbi:hypothetical protein [uncultured Phenylobacterium sp.]|uniref:hypothetical protein n=1 Tax=uncultured Phenylobacterium sp. TaxID=349273 RepID=UPI0025F83B71|nr:hypothetical protein [uncultured Phenylobacterium sp.]
MVLLSLAWLGPPWSVETIQSRPWASAILALVGIALRESPANTGVGGALPSADGVQPTLNQLWTWWAPASQRRLVGSTLGAPARGAGGSKRCGPSWAAAPPALNRLAATARRARRRDITGGSLA